jgi:hypothetical protein
MVVLTLKASDKFYEAILREDGLAGRYITTLRSAGLALTDLASFADDIYEKFRSSVESPDEIKFVFEKGQIFTRDFSEGEIEDIKKEILSRYKTH